MDERRVADRALRLDDPARDRSEQLDVAVVARQVRRPDAALAAEPDVHERLVERREGGQPAAVAVGDRCAVLRDATRVIVVDELVVEPERRPVVHEVDDWLELELLKAVNDAVEPPPHEAAGRRLDSVPRNPVADRRRAALAGEPQILMPEVVVLRQLVLVERAAPADDLRHKRVLDPDGEAEPPVGELVRHLVT